MRRFDPACQAALITLLAQPDDRTLRGRGHRRTQLGARQRFDRFAERAHAWVEETRARLIGACDEGWKPAVTAEPHRLVRFHERLRS